VRVLSTLEPLPRSFDEGWQLVIFYCRRGITMMTPMRTVSFELPGELDEALSWQRSTHSAP
jgi:hypothetical protein